MWWPTELMVTEKKQDLSLIESFIWDHVYKQFLLPLWHIVCPCTDGNCLSLPVTELLLLQNIEEHLPLKYISLLISTPCNCPQCLSERPLVSTAFPILFGFFLWIPWVFFVFRSLWKMWMASPLPIGLSCWSSMKNIWPTIPLTGTALLLFPSTRPTSLIPVLSWE